MLSQPVLRRGDAAAPEPETRVRPGGNSGRWGVTPAECPSGAQGLRFFVQRTTRPRKGITVSSTSNGRRFGLVCASECRAWNPKSTTAGVRPGSQRR